MKRREIARSIEAEKELASAKAVECSSSCRSSRSSSTRRSTRDRRRREDDRRARAQRAARRHHRRSASIRGRSASSRSATPCSPGMDDRDAAGLRPADGGARRALATSTTGACRSAMTGHVHARRVSGRAAAVHREGPDAGRDAREGRSRCAARSRSTLDARAGRPDKMRPGMSVKVELQRQRRWRASSSRAARLCSTKGSSAQVRLASDGSRDVDARRVRRAGLRGRQGPHRGRGVRSAGAMKRALALVVVLALARARRPRRRCRSSRSSARIS